MEALSALLCAIYCYYTSTTTTCANKDAQPATYQRMRNTQGLVLGCDSEQFQSRWPRGLGEQEKWQEPENRIELSISATLITLFFGSLNPWLCDLRGVG